MATVLSLSGCGRPVDETATVEFNFSKDSLDGEEKKSSDTNQGIQPLAGGDGGFGLSSPLAFTDFNCFGVFVDYPDQDFGISCTNGSGAVVAKPDKFLGTIPLGSGQTGVLTGDIRLVPDTKFHVVTFQSSNGTCPKNPDDIGNLQSTLSPPSLANGPGEIVPVSTGNNVIALTASNAGRRDINNCSGNGLNFNSLCNGSTATNHKEIPFGSGFLLCNPEQMVSLADAPAGDFALNYTMGRDIDMANVTSKVIGQTAAASFTGTFDGSNKTLSNFSTNQDTANIGLFRAISGGTVSNLRLVNHNITARGTVGGIAGLVATGAGGTIRNIVYESGSVNCVAATGTNTEIGSIVGRGNSSANVTIERIVSKANVNCTGTGTNYIGGIVGRAVNQGAASNQIKITNAVMKGNVSGNGTAIGGIVGQIGCTNGKATNTDVFDSYFTGSLTGSTAASDAGGIAGSLLAGGACNRVSVFRTYSTGSVSNSAATTNAGGLAGKLDNTGTASDVSVRDSFFAGSVTAGATTAFGYAATTGTVANTNTIRFSGATCVTCANTGTTAATGTISDFYSSANAPMSAGTPWNFTNTWLQVPGTFPQLRTETQVPQ